MPVKLEFLEVNPSAAPAAAVIWLHGLGVDGHDFEPIVPELELPEAPPVRFVFPHAPRRSVTINAGMVMPAWFDILDMGGSHKVNIADILESSRQLAELVEAETRRGLPPERIVLAGFSQGGTIALNTGLRYEKKLAGILALSTHLPAIEQLADEHSEANRDIPIFMAHGSRDPMIEIRNALATRDALRRRGYRPAWHEYPMGHTVCAEEIGDIRTWLLDVLD